MGVQSMRMLKTPYDAFEISYAREFRARHRGLAAHFNNCFDTYSADSVRILS
jgi:hypothetical protein